MTDIVETLEHAIANDIVAFEAGYVEDFQVAVAEIRKLRRTVEIQAQAMDRWCPCSGCRGKQPPGYCPVCENDALARTLKTIVDMVDTEFKPETIKYLAQLALDQSHEMRTRFNPSVSKTGDSDG